MTLADDLFFFANGKDHGGKAIKGMEISFQFFQDIGAKVAKNKCFMISSCEKTGKRLRGNIFGQEGVPMQIINQFRDLGGHVCMDLSKSGVTLNQRMDRAIRYIGSSVPKYTKKKKQETCHNQNRYTSSRPVRK